MSDASKAKWSDARARRFRAVLLEFVIWETRACRSGRAGSSVPVGLGDPLDSTDDVGRIKSDGYGRDRSYGVTQERLVRQDPRSFAGSRLALVEG
jgi:hypothetical protein